MSTRDFEVRQVLKAYRNGIISEELFAQEMDRLCGPGNENPGPKASKRPPGGGLLALKELV